MGVTIEGDEHTLGEGHMLVLASLAAEITQWLARREFHQDIHVNLHMHSGGVTTLDVIFLGTSEAWRDDFTGFWSGREIVWNGGSNIKYFE